MAPNLNVIMKALKKTTSKPRHVLEYIKQHQDDHNHGNDNDEDYVGIPHAVDILKAIKANHIDSLQTITQCQVDNLFYDSEFTLDLMDALAQGPEVLERCSTHPYTQALVTALFDIMHNVEHFVFKSVSSCNEALIEYLKDDPKFAPGFVYAAKPNIARILCIPKSVELLLKYFDVTDEAKDAMIEAALSRLNTDVLELLV